MPERIQRQRTKGWRMPAGAVYVGRPSRWGNPFTVGAVIAPVACAGTVANIYIDTRAHAVQAYRRWLSGVWSLLAPGPPTIEQIRAELRGHNLACWCPPGPCHADVLLELANQEVE